MTNAGCWRMGFTQCEQTAALYSTAQPADPYGQASAWTHRANSKEQGRLVW